MTLTTILILMCCGVLTNVMSALFGIGGGVLMVPILHSLFPEFPLQMVAATSLTTVMGTALINLIGLHKQHIPIQIKSLLIWSAGMVIGVQLGFEISFLIPNEWIISIFVLTLLVLAFRSFFAKKMPKTTACYKDNHIKGFCVSFFGGGIAGITGIGGGSIMSPLLNLLPNVKPYQLAVYCNYMMIIGGIANLYGYLSRTPAHYLDNSWQVGYVNFSIVAIVIFCSFMTSFFSMKLRGLLQPYTVQRLLGITLMLIASYMSWLQWFK